MDRVKKTILHVDINSYFATLLQQENPLLRHKPIAVTKDQGRSCVIAASKEAKHFGVQTGCRLSEAKQLCPHILAVPVDFNRCLDATYRLKKIFNSIAPEVYIFSLDEAFIDISDCLAHIYDSPRACAELIQHQIKQELGEWVTCNIGISHNRLLAKMASEIAPKGSIQEVTEANKDHLLADTPFRSVCGVGVRLETKLRTLGATTPYLIRFIPTDTLQSLVGPFWTTELQKIAWGEEPHFLQLIDRPLPHMKSVGRSITGYKLCDNEEVVKSVLYNLTEEVTHKVRKMNLAGRQVSIGLRGEHGEHWGSFKTLPRVIRHTPEMFAILYHQLYSSWHRSFKIIKFSVRLSLLEPYQQMNLLPEWKRYEQLAFAQDQITQKYGLFTVKSGAMLHHRTIMPEVTGFLGDAKYLGLR